MRQFIAVSLIALSLVLLGTGCATSRIANGGEVQITLDANAALAVEGRNVALADLGSTFENLGVKPETPVSITADRSVRHEQVIAILDELKKLGRSNVSFATAE